MEDIIMLLGLDDENEDMMEWVQKNLKELQSFEDLWLAGDYMRIDNLEEYRNVEVDGVSLLVK